MTTSFTRPYTYTNGTAIAAADVRGNHLALRQWLNATILPADILAGSIQPQHIEAPEYQPVTQGCRLTTGDIGQRFITSDPSRQSVVGQSMQNVQNGTATLYVPVLAADFYVASDFAFAMVQAYLAVRPAVNDVPQHAATTGEADVAQLFIDDEPVPTTAGGFFAQDAGGGTAQGSGSSESREMPVFALLDGLTRGYHTVVLGLLPRHDLSLVRARSLITEIFEV